MTLLMTLLTFFLGGGPRTAIVPPEPTHASGAITVQGEFEQDHLGWPRITPPAWHGSPSWMVAAPPVPPPVAFDVFAPAVRPPHEFPTLFPCAPLALVPCPLPTPEPPAVRHVSFLGDAAEYRLAAHETECGPAGQHAISGFPFRNTLPGKALWEELHFHQYAPTTQYQAPHYPDPNLPHPPQFQVFRAEAMPGACPAFCPGGACPAGVCPAGVCPGGVCPAGFACPAAEAGPFPGAKNVEHLVRATYDVPHATSKALEPILENSEGVQGCVVNGDELTINATAPAQASIAQFLANVVTKTRMVSQPKTAITVKYTEVNSCPDTTATSKCCNGQCDCKDKCQCECQDKCNCCGKAKPDTTGPSASTVPHSGKPLFNVTTWNCQTCPGECQGMKLNWNPAQTIEVKMLASSGRILLQTSDGVQITAKEIQLKTNNIGELKAHQIEGLKLPAAKAKPKNDDTSAALNPETENEFQVDVGTRDVQACPTANCKPVDIDQKAEMAKATQVKIYATSEGVVMWTSEGMQIRAKSIQMETGSIGKLQVHQADAVLSPPRTETKPATNIPFEGRTLPKPKNKPTSNDTSAALNPEAENGFFRLGGPYSTVSEASASDSETKIRYFRFGGVEIRR